MKTLFHSAKHKAFLLLSLLVVLVLPSAKAASGTWNVDGNGVWSGSTNWLGNVIADGAGSTGNFSAVNLTVSSTVTIDTTSRTLGTLTIGDAAAPNVAHTFDASGGATLTMNNSGSGALISRSLEGTTTISVPLILADNLTIRKAGNNSFTVNGGITSTGGTRNLVLENNSGQTLTLNTGTVNHVGSITSIGGGSGATTINAAIGANVTEIIQNSTSSTLNLGTANSAFTGSVSVQNGTLNLGNSSLSVNNLVTMSASGIFENNAAAGLTIAGLNGAGGTVRGGNTTSLRSLTLGGSGTYNYGGAITDLAVGTGGITSITNSGTGTQTLSGSNTYTGATSVTAGTLLIDGSSISATTVSNGRLGGTGTITNTVTVTGGTLAPGGSTGDTILSVNGNVAMSASSVFAVTLNGTTVGTNYDQLSIASGSGFAISGGAVTLSLTLGYAAQLNDTFTIIDIAGAGTFAGSFANLAPSGTITVSGVEFTANNYGTVNDLVLTVTAVPEPRTAVLMGLGTAFMLFRLRRRWA